MGGSPPPCRAESFMKRPRLEGGSPTLVMGTAYGRWGRQAEEGSLSEDRTPPLRSFVAQSLSFACALRDKGSEGGAHWHLPRRRHRRGVRPAQAGQGRGKRVAQSVTLLAHCGKYSDCGAHWHNQRHRWGVRPAQAGQQEGKQCRNARLAQEATSRLSDAWAR